MSERQLYRKRAYLAVPPTGKYIREDRCQTPIEEFTTIALRPPVDLLYMAGSLEETGVECRLRDFPAEELEWLEFERDIRQFNPDMLVLSITTPSLERDMRACELAKSINPDCLTVAKGAHFAHSDEKALGLYPHLDVAIRGEYELVAGEIAQADDLHSIPGLTFRSRTGEIVRNPDRELLQDLDRIPYPARHLARNELYFRPDTGEPQTTIVTSRGCPARCVYCLAPKVAGSRVRRRSPENIIGELRQCVEKHGIRDFLFRSDTFTMDRKWVISLCEAISESGLDIRWSCNSRVDTICEDRLNAMKTAGCWLIAFGVESGSEDLLKKMRKGATVDQARQAMKLCRKMGVKSSIYLLVGLPWETEETFRETAEFACELNPDFLEVFYPYPFQGTELYQIAVQEGLLEDGSFPVESYSRPACPALNYSVEELAHMRRRLLRKFYLRPSFICRTLFSTRSPKVFLNYVRYGARQLTDLLTGT
jgi:anaerobic magnesium-protoporphyrin IX monomethyl ester cyclase